MGTVKTKKFQHIVDISIQETGTAENLMLIARTMDVSPTEAVEVDTDVFIPDNAVTDLAVKNYYRNRDLHPASDNLGIFDEAGIFDNTFDNTFE